MNRKKAFIVLAVTSVMGFLGAASAVAASDVDEREERGGYVVPCSLSGVNPALHPEIFGNPAAARKFGFVQSRDGVWHVQCSGAGAPAAADNYASTNQKVPSHHRKTALKPSGRAVKGE